MTRARAPWRLIVISHPIADTGDYSVHYEITDGNVALITQDDGVDALQPIVNALNDSGCSFCFDNSKEYVLSHENDVLRKQKVELLETLKGVLSSLLEYEIESRNPRIQKARQAIAKAEGI